MRLNTQAETAVDQALVTGQSVSDISARYSTVGRMALQRHKTDHLAETLSIAQNAKEISRSDVLIDDLIQLEQNVLKIGVKAEKAGDWRSALAAIREQTRIIELRAKVQGILDDRMKLTINNQQISAHSGKFPLPDFKREIMEIDDLIRESYEKARDKISHDPVTELILG